MATKKLQILGSLGNSDADTLDGKHASEFALATDIDGLATETFVTNKIAEAQISGGSGDIDLSNYATKDDLANIDFPVDSVNGKTGTVQLSASDVGAAPDGYGLGTIVPADVTTLEQLDSTRNSGFYRLYIEGGTTICNITFTYASLAVYPIGTGGSIQELRPYGSNQCLRRYYSGGNWNSWVHVGPAAFAPTGYGLGLTTPTVVTNAELDTTRKIGFYRFVPDATTTICGISFASASLAVYSNTANSCMQELRPHKTNYCLRRNYVGGSTNKWSGWILTDGEFKDLLWENDSLTSNFAAQTIALDLSFYDAVYVEAVRATDDNIVSDAITVAVGGLPGFLIGHTEEFAVTRRRVTATTTGVKFLGFYSANTTNGATNDIPYRIWGVKMRTPLLEIIEGGVITG